MWSPTSSRAQTFSISSIPALYINPSIPHCTVNSPNSYIASSTASFVLKWTSKSLLNCFGHHRSAAKKRKSNWPSTATSAPLRTQLWTLRESCLGCYLNCTGKLATFVQHLLASILYSCPNIANFGNNLTQIFAIFGNNFIWFLYSGQPVQILTQIFVIFGNNLITDYLIVSAVDIVHCTYNKCKQNINMTLCIHKITVYICTLHKWGWYIHLSLVHVF